jgi:hypothetical protein
MRALFALATVLLAVTASAQEKPWLKRENPETLLILASNGDECPTTLDQMKGAVRRVIVRSRVTPVFAEDAPDQDALVEPPGLLVSVHCKDDSDTFQTLVEFIALEADREVRYELYGHGYFGNHGGDAEYVLDAVMMGVQQAMADYVEANVDL